MLLKPSKLNDFLSNPKIVFVLEGGLNPFPLIKMEIENMISILEGNFKSESQKNKEQKVKDFLKSLGIKGIVEKLN